MTFFYKFLLFLCFFTSMFESSTCFREKININETNEVSSLGHNANNDSYFETDILDTPYDKSRDISTEITFYNCGQLISFSHASNGLILNNFNQISNNLFRLSFFPSEIESNLSLFFSFSNNEIKEVSFYVKKTEQGFFVSNHSLNFALENYYNYLFDSNLIEEVDYYNFLNSVSANNFANVSYQKSTINSSGAYNQYATINGYCSFKKGSSTFPLKYIKVEFVGRTIDGVSLLTTYTDENGYFEFSINSANCYSNHKIRFVSQGQNASVVKSLFWNNPYYVETNEYHGLIEPCMNIFYSLSINMNTIQGKAFYVAQALIFGDLYVQEINGCSLGLVSAKYPSTHNYTNVFGIQIDENNYNSWDVILHEYGHFIQGKLELSNSNGQSHIVTEDLIARYGKTSGVRLSWAEAFPNVISVIITEYFYNYIPYVDYINDGQYNTIGSNGIMWALKIEEKELINSIGEGCEADIGNILYDIYDPTNESFDKICLGHSVFWNTLKNSKAKTLSDFVQYCYLSPLINNNNLNALLAEHGVTINNLFIEGDSLHFESPPTFKWTAPNNGSINSNLDEFVLQIYDSKKNIVLQTPSLSSFSYTLTGSEWNSVLYSYGTEFYCLVLAYQSSPTKTGAYISEEYEFVKPIKNIYSGGTFFATSKSIEINHKLSPGSKICYDLTFSIAGYKLIQTFGELDTYIEVYDQFNNHIISNDDDGYGLNSFIGYYFNANTKYYLQIGFYDENETGFIKTFITSSFMIKETPEVPITNFESIFNVNNNNYILHAYAQQYYSQVITFTPKNDGLFKIELESEFDNFLYLIDPTSSFSNQVNIDYNDDYNGTTNATIHRELSSTITYLIVYCHFNPGAGYENLDSGDDVFLKINKIS